MYIDFQLEKYNLGGKSKRPEVPVRFDRHGKKGGKDITWYRDKRDKGELGDGGNKKAQAGYDRVIRRWEENVTGWRPEMPNYTISVGAMVNDTELPGLKIDVEKREVRFMWKEMLQLFFREVERLQVLKGHWHTATAKKIQANNARLVEGEKLAASDYPTSWSTAKDEMRKNIRRARLKESHEEDEEMLWAIDSLKHFESHSAAAGSAKTFSINPDLPGAGLDEKWFGSLNLVQGLYLDEWSCMHRIETKLEQLRSEQ